MFNRKITFGTWQLPIKYFQATSTLAFGLDNVFKSITFSHLSKGLTNITDACLVPVDSVLLLIRICRSVNFNPLYATTSDTTAAHDH